MTPGGSAGAAASTSDPIQASRSASTCQAASTTSRSGGVAMAPSITEPPAHGTDRPLVLARGAGSPRKPKEDRMKRGPTVSPSELESLSTPLQGVYLHE